MGGVNLPRGFESHPLRFSGLAGPRGCDRLPPHPGYDCASHARRARRRPDARRTRPRLPRGRRPPPHHTGTRRSRPSTNAKRSRRIQPPPHPPRGCPRHAEHGRAPLPGASQTGRARIAQTNRVAGGRRVDCRWPEQRLTVELDGYRYHRSRHAWEHDRKREREARARGDDFRRYTYGDVLDDPRLMLQELGSLLPRDGPSSNR